MEASIIKQLTKSSTLTLPLLALLQKVSKISLQTFSIAALKNISYAIISLTCQTKNLLHYKHLEDRYVSQKCLMVIEEILGKWLSLRKQIAEYISNEFLAHISQHSSCYVSYSIFFLLMNKYEKLLLKFIPDEKLKKIHQKIISHFEEMTEIEFLHNLSHQNEDQYQKAEANLDNYLHPNKSSPHSKIKEVESSINEGKIPPLVLPSSKSINSSRYSVISRDQKNKGIESLRNLASSIGQSFIAVELGCLLAHKRTQQAQQFSENSEFRNKCLEKVQTERNLSSRLLTHNNKEQKQPQQRAEENNRKFYKKALLVSFNIIYLKLSPELVNVNLDPSKIVYFMELFLDMMMVGLINLNLNDTSHKQQKSKQYEHNEQFFSKIQLPLLTTQNIIRELMERVSFITEKVHLRLLLNRNKKNTSFHYVEQTHAATVDNSEMLGDIKLIKHEHVKMVKGSAKASKERREETDFILDYLMRKFGELYSQCDMSSKKFYKYEANIVKALAFYLKHSFSSTVSYLCIDFFFPFCLLIKRQILELIHPVLHSYPQPNLYQTFQSFEKNIKNKLKHKEEINPTIHILIHSKLITHFLSLIANLLSNNKHVEKLFSNIFIKNTYFMETIRFYLESMFKLKRDQEIIQIFQFYRQCLQIFNQRKLRNTDCKSMKILFTHLSEYFHPEHGCIALALIDNQKLISDNFKEHPFQEGSHHKNPMKDIESDDEQLKDIEQNRLNWKGKDEGSSSSSNYVHELLRFINDVYYYSDSSLSETILSEETASFYIKYSLFNFIKLYSYLTVNELVNLQQFIQLQKNELITTKSSPHVTYYPSHHAIYMIDFVKILTSISINRTNQISHKIQHYRILEFFVREFQLEFAVKENIEKYIHRGNKNKQVPTSHQHPSAAHQQISTHQPTTKDQPKKNKIPSLNLTGDIFKNKQPTEEKSNDNSNPKEKKKVLIPSLKIPHKSDRLDEKKKNKGCLDDLLDQISDGYKKEEVVQKLSMKRQFNLELNKLNLGENSMGSNMAEDEKGSSEQQIYLSERKIRKMYSNKILHAECILLVLSLILNKGLLDPEYCDQMPIAKGKINVLYILHHHLNQPMNASIIPIIAEQVSRIKPYLAGQRLLKLLSTHFTDLSHYENWTKISEGAYGKIYSSSTNIFEPSEVAIKQMKFPKNIYQRCILHDIFTEITCLEHFRLDDRITTMYNYGVMDKAYVIVMKKYDCSLRSYILKLRQDHVLQEHILELLLIFQDTLESIRLLHQQNVTHYDLKADNILLLFSPTNPTNQPSPNNQNQATKSHPKPVLADFGECKLFENEKDELDMKSRGTQCNQSPEMLTLTLQLKKQSDNYDRRKKVGTTKASDIWCLGCLFYEMLTGDYLFPHAYSDWGKFYLQVTSPTLDILTPLNQEKLNNNPMLIQFLKFMLIREPKHRPSIHNIITRFEKVIPFISHHHNHSISSFPSDTKQLHSLQAQNYIKSPNKSVPNLSQKNNYHLLETLLNQYIDQIFIKNKEISEDLRNNNAKNSHTSHQTKSIHDQVANNASYKLTANKSVQEVRKQPCKSRVVGNKYQYSYSKSKNNKFLRIMDDIYYCQGIKLQEGAYYTLKQLGITHIITTTQSHHKQSFNHDQSSSNIEPSQLLERALLNFNVIRIEPNNQSHTSLAFRLSPQISDVLREVLLIKGKLLFINDESNYVTNLLMFTLSYWFKCSIYETWCLINTQILLFPTFTAELVRLSFTLQLLNSIDSKVQGYFKLQCICGSVTLILKKMKKQDRECVCKKKKIHAYDVNANQCSSLGCSNYINFVKNRYNIRWPVIRWMHLSSNTLLTSIFPNHPTQSLKTQILLNSAEPSQNLVDIGSALKHWKVYSCRVCEMMMLTRNEQTKETWVVLNNLIKKIRQGIMIPNAQENFKKRTPALNNYTLSKLHMTTQHQHKNK